MLVQSCTFQISIKNNSTKFLNNFLLTSILHLLTCHFFVKVTLPMQVAMNKPLSQSSKIITSFNHVVHKHSSSKS